jgi:uncharacterized protein with von Willebrand factor type A (vWA) domain
MPEYAPLDLPDSPKLAANITWFARALRKAGLPIGPGQVLDAIRAVAAVGFSEREDFYWTLQAVFVRRPEHRATFAQVFRLFWRDPRYMEHMIAMLTPSVRGVQEERRAQAAEKRAAEALLDGAEIEVPKPEAPEEELQIDIDASQTASGEERLRSLDFEQMSGAEMAAAKRMIARLTLPVRPLMSRRTRAAPQGALFDPRATLLNAMRNGGEIRDVSTKTRRERWPNLVVLCDISGSMSQYSRIVLHFLHAVSNHKGAGWAKVHAFTFGTRLTNITRHLRQRDVDAALAAAGAEAQDWEGGTRIGTCLRAFNRDWARRVLGQGAVVLLITDGLTRDDPDQLGAEMERLHLSSRRLIWLNPLLRWDQFAAKAKGVQAMLPHVDAVRAAHNVASLEALAEAISRPEDLGEKARLLASMTATAAEPTPAAPSLRNARDIGKALAAMSQRSQ